MEKMMKAKQKLKDIIQWFNAFWSKSVKINIDKQFFQTTQQSFPTGPQTSQNFFPCIINLKDKTYGHNNKILKNALPPKEKRVNISKKKTKQ